MNKITLLLLTFLTLCTCSKKEINYTFYKPSWEDIYYKKPAFTKGWKYIIIHHSATRWGNAKSFHDYHTKKGYGGLAYHFVICNGNGGKDGKIEAGFRWKYQIMGTHCTLDAAYHNVFGIGICLVGNFQKTRPTKKQLKSLIALIKKLVNKYKMKPKDVMGHGGVPHTEVDWTDKKFIVRYTGSIERRVCPGRYFPMNYVKKMVFRRR